LKHAKRNATKALFVLAVSLLVAGFVIPPAAAASTTSSGGSNAQSLIDASAPHTYVDFKSSWAGDTAATLAKYDVVALGYTETSQHIQAIKAINPNTVVLAYFNPLFGGPEGTPHTDWYLRDASGNTHSSGYPNEPLMDLTRFARTPYQRASMDSFLTTVLPPPTFSGREAGQGQTANGNRARSLFINL
jgi:hypothetical protein